MTTKLPNPFEVLGVENPFRRLPPIDFAPPPATPVEAEPVVILPRRQTIREILTRYDERGRIVS